MWPPRRTSRALAATTALVLLVVLTACSPRPAPLGARLDADGELVAVLPECDVATYAVLVYPAGEGPGAAPLQQVEVPDEGGAVPMGITVEPGVRYELALSQTSFEIDAEQMSELRPGQLLAAGSGAATARVVDEAEWRDDAEAFCSAGDRDLLLLGALLAGFAVVVLAVTVASVRAWQAGRRPGVVLTAGLLLMGCLGWAGLVALWVHAGSSRRADSSPWRL